MVGRPMMPVKVAGFATSSKSAAGGSGVSSPAPSWCGIIGMKNGVVLDVGGRLLVVMSWQNARSESPENFNLRL